MVALCHSLDCACLRLFLDEVCAAVAWRGDVKLVDEEQKVFVWAYRRVCI